MEDVRLPMRPIVDLLRSLCTRENLYAVLLCMILIAILIMTADISPQWIYQGF